MIVFLLRQVFSILGAFPIITFAILGLIVLAYHNDFRRQRHNRNNGARVRLFWGIIVIQFIMIALVVGTAAAYWETSQSLWIVGLSFWFQIIMTLLSIVMAKGFRLFAITVNLLTLPLGIMSGFVGSMAITGLWI